MTSLLQFLHQLFVDPRAAPILRQQIGLLNSQLSIFQAENVDLKATVKDLRHEIEECEKLNESLKQQLAKHNIPPVSASSEPGPDDYHVKRRRLI